MLLDYMVYEFWVLEFSFFIWVVGMYLIPKFNLFSLKSWSLIWSYLVFFQILILGLIIYNMDLLVAPVSISIAWLNLHLSNISYIISIDVLSYIFMLLTSLLIPLCILSSWNNIKFNLREFLTSILLVEWILINMFVVADLLLFYIWFEAVLLPMYFLIGTWGSRQRKTYASFMFFFYTFIGSLFLLFGLYLLYVNYFSLSLFSLINANLSVMGGLLVWPLLMFAFAVKVPMFPAHIWLPEAHVEAPTVGSVLLAGVLLKLGIFAVLRFLIPIFPSETQYFAPLLSVLALIGILYVSLTTIRQIDLKKIIAYASVAHMNYVVLGVFGTNALSVSGSIFLMVGHGVVSAGLFFMIGFLYDRYKTRSLRYYRGLVIFMPIYTVFLFIFSLANMSFPGTCNFIGESLILFGVTQSNIIVSWLAAVGIVFCAIYTIWLFNRIAYGPITPSITNFADLSYKEFLVLLPLLFLTLLLGLFPNYLLSLINDTTYILLEYYNI